MRHFSLSLVTAVWLLKWECLVEERNMFLYSLVLLSTVASSAMCSSNISPSPPVRVLEEMVEF